MKVKKIGKWVNHIQWVNVLTMIALGINNVANVVPALAAHPGILVAQGILAAVLPSLNGVGHTAAFGESQNPDDRP